MSIRKAIPDNAYELKSFRNKHYLKNSNHKITLEENNKIPKPQVGYELKQYFIRIKDCAFYINSDKIYNVLNNIVSPNLNRDDPKDLVEIISIYHKKHDISPKPKIQKIPVVYFNNEENTFILNNKNITKQQAENTSLVDLF